MGLEIKNKGLLQKIVKNRNLITHIYNENLVDKIHQKFDGCYNELNNLAK